MNLIQPFYRLCLFQLSPADLPVSQWLLKLTLVSYLIVGIAIGLIDSSLQISLLSSVSDAASMAFFLWIMLKLRGMTNRYYQSLTAMAGAGTILGLIAIPVMMLFNQVDEVERANSYVMLPVVIMMFWSLMVTAHILKESLDIKSGTAAILTVIYTIISLIVVGLVNSGVS
jgi:hypothetical protein